MNTLSKIVVVCITTLSAIALADQPNVVILLTDDQGTLDAHCYGSTDLDTPNIDKLAASGVRFTQAYAHTVCCPTRAMLLTGRHPQRSGVRHWTQGDMNAAQGINMALREVTLAEALKAAGYRTALYGKWHLGAHRDYGPKKQGFDEFFGIRDGFIDNYNHHYLHGKGYHDLYEGTTPVHARGEYFPEMMVHRALKFIDDNKQRPFFLYVPFNIPHYPEQALQQFEKQYAELSDEARRSYAAIVSTTDHYIGQILDRLETHRLRENTIVVFMSDNGHSEETRYRIKVDNHASGLPKGHFYGASGGGNTGKWLGHKSTFLEGGIRVPAIISFPDRLPLGEVRSQVVTAMDWMPTILELCNVAPPPVTLDGSSLLPIIKSTNAKSHYNTLHWQWGDRWAVRQGDWKLIGQKGEARSLGNLSDLEPEKTNYLPDHPEIVARLLALHNQWANDVRPTTGDEKQ
jgi:arylsulfatase A-like enzyme